jgi:hypothetical protein
MSETRRPPSPGTNRQRGDGLRFGVDGSLVGITILNARSRVDADGEIAITLPQQRVVVKDLGGALTRA